MVSYKGKHIRLIKAYFNRYVDELGDLTNYNPEPREMEFINEHRVHFIFKWLGPLTIELFMSIYDSDNNLVTSSWIVKDIDEWTIIPY